MIITPDYHDHETKYTARDITEVRPEHVKIAQLAISVGASIGEGMTIIENTEGYFFHEAHGKQFLHVTGRDYTFGSFHHTEKGWVAKSWYFRLMYGVVDKDKSQYEVFDTEDEARLYLISQYKKNAWGV